MIGNTLLTYIKQAEEATARAIKELDARVNRYGLTPADVQKITVEAQAKLDTEIFELMQGGRAEIKAALIGQMQKEERDRAARLANMDYLQKLNTKIDFLQRLNITDAAGRVTADSVMVEALRKAFAEYADDPLAIGAIKAAPGGAFIAPENSGGKYQKALQTLEALFEKCIDKMNPGQQLANAAAAYTGEPAAVIDPVREVDAFKAYLQRCGDLDRPPAEVLQDVVKADESLHIGAGMWAARMGEADAV